MKWIKPMDPIICTVVKEDSRFFHEIKWDGIRGMSYIDSMNQRVFTKRGNERTEFYPELQLIHKALAGKSAILDGEIIVPDEKGLPSFRNSLIREKVRNKRNLQYYTNNYPVKYIIFDILQLEDKLLINTPLIQRKEILEQLMKPIINKTNTIILSEVYSNGNELYEQMKQRNMEGIVSKSRDSHYIEGKKHDAWFKTKFIKRILCVVGGIQLKGDIPNSLILGIKSNEQDELIYVGKASLGLKQTDLMLLKDYKNQLEQEQCPFDEQSVTQLDETGTGICWFLPIITCWISFLEFTKDGQLRHPKIIGFTSLSADEAYGKVLSE